jgi:multiple sugar transport system permease protein
MQTTTNDRKGALAIVEPARHPSRGAELLYRLANSKDILSVALLLPAFIILAIVFAFPVARTLILAFHKQNLLQPEAGTPFIGLANFEWIFRQESFWQSLRNTTVLTVGTVGLEVVIGLLIAALLAEPFRGYALVRGIFILPWAIPSLVVAFIMRMYMAPRFGLLNQMIGEAGRTLGLSQGPFLLDWFGNTNTAMLSVIAVTIWKGLPFVVLVFLAGLQSVPRELGEAARIDGATAWKEFVYVTLPHMRMVVVIVVIFRIIGAFNGFDLVYLLTGGGPANATRVLAIEVFNQAFVAYQMGRAASITALMLLVLGVLTFLLLNAQREEQGEK